METMKRIITDMENIMSRSKCIFAKPWNEEDCNHFIQLFFDDAVEKSRSSIELAHAVRMFGINIDTMLTYLNEKEDNSNDPF